MEEVKYGEDNYGFRVTGTTWSNNTIATGSATQDWQYVTPTYIGGDSDYRIKVYNDFNIKKEDRDMMGLYEVYAVDKKKEGFIGKETVISDDITRAIMIATKRMNIDVENENLAMEARMVIKWESKKPKEVKIVKE